MLKRVDEINSSDRKDLGLGLIDGLFSFEHLLAEVTICRHIGRGALQLHGHGIQALSGG